MSPQQYQFTGSGFSPIAPNIIPIEDTAEDDNTNGIKVFLKKDQSLIQTCSYTDPGFSRGLTSVGFDRRVSILLMQIEKNGLWRFKALKSTVSHLEFQKDIMDTTASYVRTLGLDFPEGKTTREFNSEEFVHERLNNPIE
jgi:hypothetical protein